MVELDPVECRSPEPPAACAAPRAIAGEQRRLCWQQNADSKGRLCSRAQRNVSGEEQQIGIIRAAYNVFAYENIL